MLCEIRYAIEGDRVLLYRVRRRRDIYRDGGLSNPESHLSVQNSPSVGTVSWHPCVGVVDSNHTL
jgi:hypothetical protein